MLDRVYLSLPVSDYFGYGVCGKYLLRELSRRCETFYDPVGECLIDDVEIHGLVSAFRKPLTANVEMPLIQAPGPNLAPQTPYRGEPNVAYLFTECETLSATQRDNLKAFDVLIAGSEWNAQVIREAGFKCDAVPQGVDRNIFRPFPRKALKEHFVIFSGGKWEHRKAQDLVIRAVKVLQQRHADIMLMASWFNIWDGQHHYEEARKEGIRLIELPLCSHEDMAKHMNQSDLALFPNRCEGGTNLVMMEYLACGKPVVANDSTGQRDVLDESYAAYINGSDDKLVEQMINSVEFLYQNRDACELMARAADSAMDNWPWSRTCDFMMGSMENRVAA